MTDVVSSEVKRDKTESNFGDIKLYVSLFVLFFRKVGTATCEDAI